MQAALSLRRPQSSGGRHRDQAAMYAFGAKGPRSAGRDDLSNVGDVQTRERLSLVRRRRCVMVTVRVATAAAAAVVPWRLLGLLLHRQAGGPVTTAGVDGNLHKRCFVPSRPVELGDATLSLSRRVSAFFWVGRLWATGAQATAAHADGPIPAP